MNRAPSPLRLLVLLCLCLTVVWAVRRTGDTTRVQFSVEVEGKRPLRAVVSVGGRPLSSGGQLWPGWHSVEVTGDALEPMRLRRWVWPGNNDWGVMQLRHQRGRVELTVIPTPLQMGIRAVDQALEVRETNRVTADLVVGTHVVELFYPTFTNRSWITVEAGRTLTLTTRVEAGWVWPMAEPAGARVELRQGERVVLGGNAGEVLGPVPAGGYQLVFLRGKERAPRGVQVTAAATNRVSHRFVYGRVEFASVPTGASVWLGTERVSTTPAVWEEKTPGTYRVRFEHPDMVTQEREVAVVGEQTVKVEVRLRGREATRHWERAQQAAQAGDLSTALGEGGAALRLEPDWPEVNRQQREWVLAHLLATAKSALSFGNADAAAAALAEVAKLDPGNASARQLQPELEQARSRQAEADKDRTFSQNLAKAGEELAAGRTGEALAAVDGALALRPGQESAARLKGRILAALSEQEFRKRFAAAKSRLPDARYFADVEWHFPGPPGSVEAALLRVIARPINMWETVGDAEKTEGVTILQLRSRGLVKSMRAGFVAVGPAADGGVLVLGSLVEYAVGGDFKMVPLHPGLWRPEDPQQAKERRRALIDQFDQALKGELGQ